MSLVKMSPIPTQVVLAHEYIFPLCRGLTWAKMPALSQSVGCPV